MFNRKVNIPDPLSLMEMLAVALTVLSAITWITVLAVGPTNLVLWLAGAWLIAGVVFYTVSPTMKKGNALYFATEIFAFSILFAPWNIYPLLGVIVGGGLAYYIRRNE